MCTENVISSILVICFTYNDLTTDINYYSVTVQEKFSFQA